MSLPSQLNFLTALLFTLLSSTILAQNSGDEMFDISVLHEVRIDFEDADFFNIMVSNYDQTPEGGSVPYLMGSVTIDGTPVDSVGVRFKGFTSYFADIKKPIKIDFNEFVPGRRYDGLRKLNLNNATGDPSMQRDVICYHILREMGVKAPRASYSRVYLNDEYWGIYQSIEQVDKEFIQNNFTNDDGNLFKNKGWNHFEWLGQNDINYHPPYEIKTNKDNQDWSGFVNLMDVINNAPDDQLIKQFKKIFNIDLFLKTLAVDVTTNNWDSYLEHGRNWYMYEDLVSNIFHWIPWDYNFSLGSFSFGPIDEDCFIFSEYIAWTNGTTTVEFKETGFSSEEAIYIWDFGDGNISTEDDPIHTYDLPGIYNVCLHSFVDLTCEDTYCTVINTDYDYEDCDVIQNGTCPHPVDLVFVQTISWQPDCCEIWGEECEEIHEILNGGNGFGGGDFTINQRENSGVLINRLLNDDAVNNSYYNHVCDLLTHVMIEDDLFEVIDNNIALIDTSVQQDQNFLFSYDQFIEDGTSFESGIGIKGTLSERIMNLRLEIDSIYDCPTEAVLLNAQDIVINEFMASNDSISGIVDLDGESDDWIELYNNTNSTVNLSGLYLSDDTNQLDKWQFPFGSYLLPKGYMIIWSDKDSIQFGLHSNFNLKKDGGSLILSNTDLSIVDQVDFDLQTTNVSAARIPNGTGDFVFQPATFSFNNEQTVATNNLEWIEGEIFPNPASDHFMIKLDQSMNNAIIQLFNGSGQLVALERMHQTKHMMNVSHLQNGMYFLQIRDASGKGLKKKIIVSH